jgi:ABC-type Fe3+ transport system permease subunit
LKKTYKFWVVSFVLSYLGFYLIENMFTIKPDVTSGNGNLGILVIIVFMPIFILNYFLTYKLTREISSTFKNRKRKVLVLFLSVLCCALLIFPIVNYFEALVIALGGTPSNPDSRIYRFGWFNQYTNSIFFNAYTFLLTYISAVVLGIVSSFKPKIAK